MKKMTILVTMVFHLAVSTVMAGLFDTPVAMISDTSGKVSFENSTDRSIDFGTDVFIGDLIKTGRDGTVSLTFYNGCRQETLASDSLIQVGRTESVLRKGKFREVKSLECEIPQAVLDEADSHLKAGLVMRDLKKKKGIKIDSLPRLVEKNGFEMKVWSNKGKQPVFKVGEPMVVHFISSSDAYIRLTYISSEGDIIDVTPELFIPHDAVSAGILYQIGLRNGLIATPPVGTDFIHVFASDQPVSIASGFKTVKEYFKALKDYIASQKQLKLSETTIQLTIKQ